VLALGLTRTASAFLLLPVLTNQLAPPLVRNSLFVGMGLIVMALQPAQGFEHLSVPAWFGAFLLEMFVGSTIGFFFAGVLWSLEIAGDLIDQKINTARFSLADPFSDTSTGVYGGFFARLAVFAFAASGGLLYVTTVILESYVLWPIGGQSPRLHPQDVTVFERVFAGLVALGLVFSAPTLVLTLFLDGVMGLLNRFAPQLNVFSLSLTMKMWFSVFAAAITAATLANLFANDVFSQGALVTRFLSHRAP
jgi:type III secretion protein T